MYEVSDPSIRPFLSVCALVLSVTFVSIIMRNTNHYFMHYAWIVIMHLYFSDSTHLKLNGGDRIINGYDAPYRPFFALVDTEGDGSFEAKKYCGATIVSPYVVVTAAHCVSKILEKNISVAAVQYGNFTPEGDRFEVNGTYVIHENFTDSDDDPLQSYYDIGLVLLDTPIPKHHSLPVCHGNHSEDTIIIAGMGATRAFWKYNDSSIDPDKFNYGISRDQLMEVEVEEYLESDICGGYAFEIEVNICLYGEENRDHFNKILFQNTSLYPGNQSIYDSRKEQNMIIYAETILHLISFYYNQYITLVGKHASLVWKKSKLQNKNSGNCVLLYRGLSP